MAFPKQQRLTASRDISSLLQSVRPISSGGLSMRVRPSKKIHVAVIISSRTAPKATMRTRLRRQVLESLRHILAGQKSNVPYDIVVTIRDTTSTYEEMSAALLMLVEKSGILPR